MANGGANPMSCNSVTLFATIVLYCAARSIAGHAAEKKTELRILAGDVEVVFRLIEPSADDIKYSDFYIQETEVTNRQFKQFLIDTKQTKDDAEVVEAVDRMRKSGVRSTGDVPYRIEDPESIWKNGDYPAGQDTFPVALVTLPDAQAYCKWLSEKHPQLGLYRLPTANEWMVAAYGRRKYPWGDQWDPKNVHMSCTDTSTRVRLVEQKM